MKRSHAGLAFSVCVLISIILAGCGGGGSNNNASVAPDLNVAPVFLVASSLTKNTNDGVTDDLLTAGLGTSGLLVTVPPPGFAIPAAPTTAELRRRAIWASYNGLQDRSVNGGFSRLYGPNIDINGNATTGEGKIAGTEYMAYADDGTGKKNVAMLVQVPAAFDPANPCVVIGASSGSRNVYGAVATAGEWGLKHNCAVAYSDKGTGSGIHDLEANTVTLMNGQRSDATAAGISSQFTTEISTSDLATFNAATPNRLSYKHIHSMQNPEKDWGTNAIQAAKFALYVLNLQYGALHTDGVTHLARFKPGNIPVIASSASNGGGAALAAAEQDTEGLITGVAVSEPQIQTSAAALAGLSIKRGSQTLTGTKTLYDMVTLNNLYVPCASLDPRAAAALPVPSLIAVFVAPTLATNRCTSLAAKGLLTSTTTAAQATESLNLLLAAGYQPESIGLLAVMYTTGGINAIAPAYAYAYGQFSVKDNLCGYSVAAIGTDGKPTAVAPAAIAQIFPNSPGLPGQATALPSAAAAGTAPNWINNLDPNGPIADLLSISLSTGRADGNIDGAICLRNLQTGIDGNAKRVQAGNDAARHTGNLHGKPAIIVAGLSDTLVPTPFFAWPYLAANKNAEGAASKLSMITVTNANHYDILSELGLGFDTQIVPLDLYFFRAMDAVWANIKSGTPLPPSQFVRTTPRGGVPNAAPPLALTNVPAISANPAAGDAITFAAGTLTIPN